jgi:stearoyl-CoA desaturase (delta-9 desaturase)
MVSSLLYKGLILGLLSIYLVVLVLGISNTVGYHRLLTHRSFKTPTWLRGLLTLLAAQYSGPPMQWVGAHRIHHTVSDTEGDPHTPTKGFWFAHAGWLCGTRSPIGCALFALSGFGLQGRFLLVDVLRVAGRHPPRWRTMTRDLNEEPLMRILDAPFVIPACFAVQVAACWWIGAWWGIAWLWTAHFVLNNATWIVNSACHWPGLGDRPFPTRDKSRNVPWLALLTHGESHHNTHHRYARSARHGLDGELDTSWAVIRALAWLGLAWDIQLPPDDRPAPSAPSPEPATETDG